MQLSRPIMIIIVTLVVGIVILQLVPSIFSDFNIVFLFSNDEVRNPIFGTGLGNLVPLILGFVPVILLTGLLAIGYIKWRDSKGM